MAASSLKYWACGLVSSIAHAPLGETADDVDSSSPPPSPLPSSLALSSLDAASGFIHLSTAVQVPGTLKHFFGSEARVYVLKIAYGRVEKEIKWEDPEGQVCGERGGEGMFPHLYNGGKLGRDEVESVAVWDKAEGEDWDAVVKREEGWLVY